MGLRSFELSCHVTTRTNIRTWQWQSAFLRLKTNSSIFIKCLNPENDNQLGPMRCRLLTSLNLVLAFVSVKISSLFFCSDMNVHKIHTFSYTGGVAQFFQCASPLGVVLKNSFTHSLSKLLEMLIVCISTVVQTLLSLWNKPKNRQRLSDYIKEVFLIIIIILKL